MIDRSILIAVLTGRVLMLQLRGCCLHMMVPCRSLFCRVGRAFTRGASLL
jgi:hypothetical protein